MPAEGDKTNEMGPPNTNDGIQKDRSRIPKLIGFSAKGPRNQGLSPPKADVFPNSRTQSTRATESKQSQPQKRKRDFGTLNPNTAGHVPAQPQEHRELKKARIDVSEDTIEAPIHALLPTQTTKGPRNQAERVLLEHSSIFVEDSAPTVLSQSSRVDENGSPLPYRHTRRTALHANGGSNLDEGFSDSENVEPPQTHDEFTLVDPDDDEASEPDLPTFMAPRAPRKEEVGFIPSSNSKHGPSSPSALSTISTEFQVHAVHPSGLLVNVQTDAILEPSKPHDPFVPHKNQRSSGFMDKLRRAITNKEENANRESHISAQTDAVLEPSKPQDPFGTQKRQRSNGFLHKLRHATTNKEENGNREGHVSAATQPRNRAAAAVNEDVDETLVEDLQARPRRRKWATRSSSSTSRTSSTQQESRSSGDSDDLKAAAERWRDALEPHQRNMLSVLCEISHVSRLYHYTILNFGNIEL